jgi:hypothetical protein
MTLKFAKPHCDVDAEYRAWISRMPCIVCGAPAPSHSHHLAGKGARGADPILGGSDYTCVPLCAAHHTGLGAGIHTMPLREFEARHNINLWKEAFRLFRLWLKEL